MILCFEHIVTIFDESLYIPEKISSAGYYTHRTTFFIIQNSRGLVLVDYFEEIELYEDEQICAHSRLSY